MRKVNHMARYAWTIVLGAHTGSREREVHELKEMGIMKDPQDLDSLTKYLRSHGGPVALGLVTADCHCKYCER